MDPITAAILNLFEVVLFWQVIIFGIPFLIDWLVIRRVQRGRGL